MKLRPFEWINIIALGLLVSCGTYIGNPEEDDKTAQAQEIFDPTIADPSGVADSKFTISLTDAPVDDLASFSIKIAELSAKQSEGSFIDIPVQVSDIDVLSYQNGDSIIFAASEDIPEGTYTELRLVLDSEAPVTATDSDGNTVEVNTSSTPASGLKIDVEFTISEEDSTGLTLDFDLRKSLIKTGNNYKLNPILRAQNNQDSYDIYGSGSASVACAYEEGATLDETDSCDNAISSSKFKSGAYRVAFLSPGTYTLRFFDEDGTYTDSETVTIVDSDISVNP